MVSFNPSSTSLVVYALLALLSFNQSTTSSFVSALPSQYASRPNVGPPGVDPRIQYVQNALSKETNRLLGLMGRTDAIVAPAMLPQSNTRLVCHMLLAIDNVKVLDQRQIFIIDSESGLQRIRDPISKHLTVFDYGFPVIADLVLEELGLETFETITNSKTVYLAESGGLVPAMELTISTAVDDRKFVYIQNDQYGKPKITRVVSGISVNNFDVQEDDVYFRRPFTRSLALLPQHKTDVPLAPTIFGSSAVPLFLPFRIIVEREGNTMFTKSNPHLKVHLLPTNIRQLSIEQGRFTIPIQRYALDIINKIDFAFNSMFGNSAYFSVFKRPAINIHIKETVSSPKIAFGQEKNPFNIILYHSGQEETMHQGFDKSIIIAQYLHIRLIHFRCISSFCFNKLENVAGGLADFLTVLYELEHTTVDTCGVSLGVKSYERIMKSKMFSPYMAPETHSLTEKDIMPRKAIADYMYYIYWLERLATFENGDIPEANYKDHMSNYIMITFKIMAVVPEGATVTDFLDAVSTLVTHTNDSILQYEFVASALQRFFPQFDGSVGSLSPILKGELPEYEIFSNAREELNDITSLTNREYAMIEYSYGVHLTPVSVETGIYDDFDPRNFYNTVMDNEKEDKFDEESEQMRAYYAEKERRAEMIRGWLTPKPKEATPPPVEESISPIDEPQPLTDEINDTINPFAVFKEASEAAQSKTPHSADDIVQTVSPLDLDIIENPLTAEETIALYDELAFVDDIVYPIETLREDSYSGITNPPNNNGANYEFRKKEINEINRAPNHLTVATNSDDATPRDYNNIPEEDSAYFDVYDKNGELVPFIDEHSFLLSKLDIDDLPDSMMPDMADSYHDDRLDNQL